MDERKRREFCRSMGIPYTPPTSAPKELPKRKTCARVNCDNAVGDRHFAGTFHDFCSAVCARLKDKPKGDRTLDGSRL